MPSQEEIEKVIESTDMVDLVSPYVNLIKQGKSYKGLCPFHNEDTPSFVVSQEKHLAHCFGCGKGGNPIKFLMEIKHVSFNEALSELAKKNNISISLKQSTKKQQDYSKYYEMMQVATKFYSQNLTMTKSGKEALDYLYKRGLNDETIKMFNIGLAPANYDSLYKVLKESNYLELDMLDLGLIGKNDSKYYDIFVKRIVFPITDEYGHVIGFSARTFNNSDKSQPKYINTKDTFLYRKGNILYHLDQAIPAITKKKRVILHEGQMDVIAATRSGLTESVCTMGTALTLEQASILKKYANNAIICYDGDNAGVNASIKAINIFKQAGMNVHLVLLTGGMDPDEYVLKYGCEKYLEYFDEHIIDEFEYLFETTFLNSNLEDSMVVENIKNVLFGHIYNMPSQTSKEKYLKLLALRLNVSLDSITSDFNSYCNIMPNRNYVENSYEDQYPDFSFDIEPAKPIIESKLKRNYELRLFLYARNSKQQAFEIDKRISNYMNAFSKINQDLWINLINVYYMKYEEFDDNLFCSLLSTELKQAYLDNLEILRGSTEVYGEEDLACIIEKMRKENYKYSNKKLTDQLNNAESVIDKTNKIAEKFKNLNKIMPTRRK